MQTNWRCRLHCTPCCGRASLCRMRKSSAIRCWNWPPHKDRLALSDQTCCSGVRACQLRPAPAATCNPPHVPVLLWQGKFVREKEIKRQTLLELVDYVNTGNGKFSEAVAEDVVFMLSSNLFRDLPALRSNELDNLDPDEEEPALEPTWPHLQVCFLLDPALSRSRSDRDTPRSAGPALQQAGQPRS